MKTDGAFLKHTGNRMRTIRKEKKISLEKLYHATGFDQDHIGRIERGQVNAHILTLKQIADVLKVDVREFL